MFGIGTPEIIIIVVVALLIFGPSKLPELGKKLGKGLREFKKASSDFKEQINPLSDFRDIEEEHGISENDTNTVKSIEKKGPVKNRKPKTSSKKAPQLTAPGKKAGTKKSSSSKPTGNKPGNAKTKTRPSS